MKRKPKSKQFVMWSPLYALCTAVIPATITCRTYRTTIRPFLFLDKVTKILKIKMKPKTSLHDMATL